MSRWKYDVFVSFRGEDIRKSFIDHLFKDFKQNGIHAFRDNIELPRGEEISPQLYKAIENSRFLMVIFSKNYASSSWCLRELVKILNSKQMENPKHEVRILFYDVKPEVVRKQTESYAEAFAKHEVSNRAEVDEWKEALSMAANLSGWDLNDTPNGYESKFIDCISKDIRKTLCDVPLHVGSNAEDVEGGSDLNEDDQGESSGTVVENPAAADVSGSSTEESSGTVVENPAADVSGTKAEVLGGSVL